MVKRPVQAHSFYPLATGQEESPLLLLRIGLWQSRGKLESGQILVYGTFTVNGKFADFKIFVLCNSSRIFDVYLWFVLDSKLVT